MQYQGEGKDFNQIWIFVYLTLKLVPPHREHNQIINGFWCVFHAEMT